jgi:hypothetical protein
MHVSQSFPKKQRRKLKLHKFRPKRWKQPDDLKKGL